MYPIARPPTLTPTLAGTRFRLFPQSPETGLFSEPETVIIARPPGGIGPGPCDDRMYVADAIGKLVPYGEGVWPSAPPWPGLIRPPVPPGPDGNFDHIPVDSPDFLPVHMYGVVRLVLDIWESYLGGPVQWVHGSQWPRLELVPVVDWDNAHFGPGYMEAGIRRDKKGIPHLFCLNFDVLAHEMAHAILFSVVGFPSRSSVTAEYLGFQEGCSDFMALVSALHFASVIDLTLDETGGNLYVLNTLSRIGETSATEQIRIASNDLKLSDFAGVAYTPNGRWVDPTGQERDAHELSLPLSGALFDILVEFFQDGLVARGIIPPDDDVRGWSREEVEGDYDRLARIYGVQTCQPPRRFPAVADRGARSGRPVPCRCPDPASFRPLRLRRSGGPLPDGGAGARPGGQPQRHHRAFPVARDRPAGRAWAVPRHPGVHPGAGVFAGPRRQLRRAPCVPMRERWSPRAKRGRRFTDRCSP